MLAGGYHEDCRNMVWMRRVPVLVVCMGIATGVAACKQDERDRPLTFDKGVYVGEKGSVLTSEQQQQLRRRNRLQASGGL
jgi:hypothetical protein